jgi:hypothetical protein
MKAYLKKQMEARQKKAEEEYKNDLDNATRTQALID